MTETAFPDGVQGFNQCWIRLGKEEFEKLGLNPEGHAFPRDQLHEALLATFKRFVIECYALELRARYARAWQSLDTQQALMLRAVTVHHWQIDYAQSLTISDLAFALHDEICHFKLPDPAFRTAYGKLMDFGPRQAEEMLEPHRPDGLNPPRA
ncbi:hypothetical protein [Modicisalibacter coralii]|uniref:hypothetical protein n=1 Tax=Modicisalibacter coralii TaxID=2304602 RepID=UPI00100BAC0A|nr:hypothetical protein [Halomonas coralii]